MQNGAEVVDVVLLREALLVLVRCVCCCNALQRTVALQYTATHCSAAIHCNALLHTAAECNASLLGLSVAAIYCHAL